jgi:hypothetical protein
VSALVQLTHRLVASYFAKIKKKGNENKNENENEKCPARPV